MLFTYTVSSGKFAILVRPLSVQSSREYRHQRENVLTKLLLGRNHLFIIQYNHIRPGPATDLKDQLVAEPDQAICVCQIQRRNFVVQHGSNQFTQARLFAVKPRTQVLNLSI